MKLAQFFWDQQRRLAELIGLPAFTIWNPEVPDARIRDVKKRGLIRGEWGPMSRVFCVDCHRPAPMACPESMLKVFYKCNRCVGVSGAPRNAVPVPGTEAF